MTDFSGISRAAFLIALNNGGINRNRSEKDQKQDLERFLSRQPQEILPAIDAWLTGLSEEELEVVCTGEHFEMEVILSKAPPFTNTLLNDYFDQVC